MLTFIGEREDENGAPKDIPINVTPFNISDPKQLKTLENALKNQSDEISSTGGVLDVNN